MRRLLLLLPLVLTACPQDPPPDDTVEWPARNAGTLLAGAADGYLDLPVGVPMGGYTGRDRALGSDPGPDARNSDYRTDFVPSGGWQTRIPLQALWLETEEASAVILRVDLIYSFDELTEEIGRRLTEATGEDLTDAVFTVTSHSHSSYGAFSNAIMLFFGADFFRPEIFERTVEQAVAAALLARSRAAPAAIGLGIDPSFDLVGEDRVFRDRREENNDLPDPDGVVHGPWKDERATLLRVDGADGSPIAALFAFGVHGTIMGGDNPLITSETPGHITDHLRERHGGPVWMFAQGAGGDASPGGVDDAFARMESLGELAAERLLALYDATTVSADPLALEAVQRHVRQGREITVTRDGTTDLRYLPWDEDWADDPYEADERIWSSDDCAPDWHPGCEVVSPLDEFWPKYGAALCGGADIDISLFGLGVDFEAYKSCLDLQTGRGLFAIAFDQYIENRDEVPLPLPESKTTMLGALGLTGIPVTTPGEGTTDKDVVIAFAPGEATTLWTQFFRHRAAAEQGVAEPVVFAYADDHEGYLLTVEDWLQSGYEPSITWWGPLQGEHILERLLEVAGLAATPVREDGAYPDYPAGTDYPVWDIPWVVPDDTPQAGTVGPLPEYLYVRDGVLPTQAQPEATIPRVQGIARWTFIGSDPATGLVEVELQHDDGGWAPVQTPHGRVWDALPDLIVTYTPDPLSGTAGEPDPVRTHRYHVEWQAVRTGSSLADVPGLPLGSYRLVARGGRRDPADQAPPYDTIPWELASDPFEVVPAAVQVTAEGLTLRASYAAAPRGFRLLSLASSSVGPTALVGATVTATAGGDPVPVPVASAQVEGGQLVIQLAASPGAGTWTLTVDDGFGNAGTVEVTLP